MTACLNSSICRCNGVILGTIKIVFLISPKILQVPKSKVAYLEDNHQQDLLYFQLVPRKQACLEDNKKLTHLVAKLNKI